MRRERHQASGALHNALTSHLLRGADAATTNRAVDLLVEARTADECGHTQFVGDRIADGARARVAFDERALAIHADRADGRTGVRLRARESDNANVCRAAGVNQIIPVRRAAQQYISTMGTNGSRASMCYRF